MRRNLGAAGNFRAQAVAQRRTHQNAMKKLDQRQSAYYYLCHL
jgi:hypothetical protein